MISIESLYKQYGLKKILKDINLSFESGKIYGIVGENGAGKTTLFKCISSLETYQGKVNYWSVSKSALKDACGFFKQ